MSRPWLGLFAVFAMLVFATAVFPLLPDRIPIHWNAAGEVDDWASRWPAAFLGPGVALALWVLFWILPRIDPRGAHYERFWQTYWLIANLTILFMGLIEVVALGSALGWPVDVARAIPVAVGIVFLALGNYLPRVRSNWWMGIRTPWTLESETVWRATHRFAGRTFVVGGLILIATAFVPVDVRPYFIAAGVGIGGFLPAIYSYIVWRREKRGRSG